MMRRALHRLRVLTFPCCDLLQREYGALNGGSYPAYYPRYWLFGIVPVKVGWKSVRYRYDLALQLIEKDRMADYEADATVLNGLCASPDYPRRRAALARKVRNYIRRAVGDA